MRNKTPDSTRPRRKMPPPEGTGRELRYMQQLKETRKPVAVVLDDGTRHRGIIEYFDRAMLKLTRPDGPNIFLRKEVIRYIEER